jgi:hypothetical protein
MLEKIFWNLRIILVEKYRVANHDLDSNKNINNEEIFGCEIKKYTSDTELKNMIKDFKKKDYYRSFINKLIIVNKSDNTVYLKPLECSTCIFKTNYFNLYTSMFLFDRELYEKIMLDPSLAIPDIMVLSKIKNNKLLLLAEKNHKFITNLPEFYYEYDYAFPNLNYCFFTQDKNPNKEKFRKARIEMMYYTSTILDSEENWHKIMIL